MLTELFTDANNQLRGEPEQVLTWGLLIAAGVLVFLAFNAPPVLKAGALLWVVAP